MSYMYNQLKEALGGDKFVSSSTNQIKDWSPNNVKAIIIAREFILVAYHTKPPKTYFLDPMKISDDFKRNGSTGALHNLLSNRQLSCLEEIYVDALFKGNYKGLMDLPKYVSKLMSDSSRLRYFGYCQNLSIQDTVKGFSNAQLNSDFRFCLGIQKSVEGKIEVEATKNSDWYKDYNLRPQFYSMDGGKLKTYFEKCENIIEQEQEGKVKEEEIKGIKQAQQVLFEQDLSHREALYDLLILSNIIQDKDDLIFKIMLASIKTTYAAYSTMTISANDLKKFVNVGDNYQKFLVSYYNNLGVVKERLEEPYTLNELVARAQANRGIVDCNRLFQEILLTFIKHIKARDKSYLILVINAILVGNPQIPQDSKVYAELKINPLKKGETSIDAYINVFYFICGLNRG